MDTHYIFQMFDMFLIVSTAKIAGELTAAFM